MIVNEETAIATKEFITKRLTAINSQRKSGELEDLALVIGKLISVLFRLFLIIGVRRKESNIRPGEGHLQDFPRASYYVQGCHLLYVIVLLLNHLRIF